MVDVDCKHNSRKIIKGEKKMKIFELSPLHSDRKSFYNKAKVLMLDDGTLQLQSYNTIVGEIKNNTYYQLWDGKSNTTSRHINEFKKQFIC